MKHLYALLLAVCMAIALWPVRAEAYGSATDTLTVKVGYYGMTDEEYVTVGTWTAQELETEIFPDRLHRVAYSFLRDKTKEKNHKKDDGDYRVVIDSAYGFYLTDLLDYCGINQSDIRQLNFCTWDQETGYFASFSANDLFGTQYFFDDLPAHIVATETDAGTVLSVGDAWDYCTQVSPMLALEDNWEEFEVGTAHVAPSFENMGTGNRFRLLFGQHDPLEGDTRRTAKYTHTVLVLLEGTPKVTEELPKLSGKIGSHRASMTISVGNSDILSNLQQLIRFSSSDDTVVTVDGVTVTPDDTYSDLAHVEISYTVLKEGEATISGSIGSMALPQTAQQTVIAEKGKSSGITEKSEADAPGVSQTETAAQTAAADAAAAPPETADHKQMVRLSGNIETILQQLGSNQGDPGDIPQTQTDSAPTVQPEDNTAALYITLFCALACMLLGGIFEWIRFRRNCK